LYDMLLLFGSRNGNVSHAFDLALDASSAPIVVGQTNGADFPTTPGGFSAVRQRALCDDQSRVGRFRHALQCKTTGAQVCFAGRHVLFTHS
jgi:hypothetical protein